MRSSTSSSERTLPGAGAPWAVLLAAAILLIVEVALHLIATADLLGYGEGLGSYYEVRHTIEEYGPSEVALLGSSRGRESILMPLLDGMLEKDLGRAVYTANYSCPDAKTSDMRLVADMLSRGPVSPDVVVYIISPRALLGDDRSPQREEVFGVFPDEFGKRSATAIAALTERPLWKLRNILQDNWLLFRHRYRIRAFLASIPRGRVPLSPVQGQETTWQRYVSDRSLRNHPISDDQVRRYVDRLLDEDGRYPLGPSRVADLDSIAAAFARAGTKFVLVEAPIADELARGLPVGAVEEFEGLVGAVAARHNVMFVTPGDLELSLGSADFREQSHLNRLGAEKMTTALVEQVLLPLMEKPLPR